jgi:hypothetical protein
MWRIRKMRRILWIQKIYSVTRTGQVTNKGAFLMKNATKQFGLTAFAAVAAFCLAALSFTSCGELFAYYVVSEGSSDSPPPPPPPSSPSTPTGVSASALSSSSIRISWNAPSSGSTPAYYRIYRSTSSYGTYTILDDVYGYSYTDNRLSASTTYYYKVSAYNSYGQSSQSSAVSATTSSSTGSGSRNITVLMRDSDGDGWNSASLRISVNGVDLSPNPTVSFTQGSSNTYTFNANTGSAVAVYWNKGSYDRECAFAIYYTNDPPSPAFNPASGATNNTARLLIHRLYTSLSSTTAGTLLGSFTVN